MGRGDTPSMAPGRAETKQIASGSHPGQTPCVQCAFPCCEWFRPTKQDQLLPDSAACELHNFVQSFCVCFSPLSPCVFLQSELTYCMLPVCQAAMEGSLLLVQKYFYDPVQVLPWIALSSSSAHRLPKHCVLLALNRRKRWSLCLSSSELQERQFDSVQQAKTSLEGLGCQLAQLSAENWHVKRYMAIGHWQQVVDQALSEGSCSCYITEI